MARAGPMGFSPRRILGHGLHQILPPSLQVVVGNDEPQDSAMKRFRREVMSAGLVQEVSTQPALLWTAPTAPLLPSLCRQFHSTNKPNPSFCELQQVRRRRYFENSVDMKKRKERESRMKAKRSRQFPPRTYSQATAQEPSPFSDMFGTPEDIFADVLGDDAPALA